MTINARICCSFMRFKTPSGDSPITANHKIGKFSRIPLKITYGNASQIGL